VNLNDVYEGVSYTDGDGDGALHFNHTVSGKQVVVKINGTVVDVVETGDNGVFLSLLTLQPTNNKLTNYHVEVVYYGDDAINFTLYALTPDNTQYAVCTTLQYSQYKPSCKSTTITVEPQATQETQPTKTPEEVQRELESSCQLTTKPKFSWWYPWFWLQTTVAYPASGFSLVSCTSLFGGWMENAQNLENPLFTIFTGVPQQLIEIVTSAAVASITTATATFVGGYIATKALEWNPITYFIAVLAYFIAVAAALGLLYTLADVYVARAILITVGWTLLSLTTLGFTKTIPIFVSKFTGGDLVTASIKCIINTLLGVAITTAILKALGASLSGFAFYFTTLILGVMALTLGYTKV